MLVKLSLSDYIWCTKRGIKGPARSSSLKGMNQKRLRLPMTVWENNRG